MPRYRIQQIVTDTDDNPLDGARVSVCVLGTTERSREPLYADGSSATRLANPLTADGSGVVDFYLATPLVCDLVPVKDGVLGQTVTVYPGLPEDGDVLTYERDVRGYVPQAPSGVLMTQGQVTDAEIKALKASPKTLIAAPAAGLTILIHRFWSVFDQRAGAYTGSWDWSLKLGTGWNLFSPQGNAGGVAATDSYGDVSGNPTSAYATLTDNEAAFPFPYDNQPLVLAGTGSVEAGGGHADNTFSWRCWYSLVPAMPFGA